MGLWFKSRWGRKVLIKCFKVASSLLTFTFEVIHNYAKWLIHELIHCVWLSIRLNNLIAGYKANWIKMLYSCVVKFMMTWTLDNPKSSVCIQINLAQWGSEICTSLDFKWSKRGWFPQVQILNGISYPEQALPFEILTNGCHFV